MPSHYGHRRRPATTGKPATTGIGTQVRALAQGERTGGIGEQVRALARAGRQPNGMATPVKRGRPAVTGQGMTTPVKRGSIMDAVHEAQGMYRRAGRRRRGL